MVPPSLSGVGREQGVHECTCSPHLAEPGGAGLGQGWGEGRTTTCASNGPLKFGPGSCLDAAFFCRFVLLRKSWSRLRFVGEIETECTGVFLYISIGRRLQMHMQYAKHNASRFCLFLSAAQSP